MNLPPFPIPPGAGATEADRQAFTDAVQLYDLALRTASLERAATDQAISERHTAALEGQAAALGEQARSMVRMHDANIAMMQQARLPDPPPPIYEQKRAATIVLLSNQARSGRTIAKMVAEAVAQVDAVFAALPAPGGAAGGAAGAA